MRTQDKLGASHTASSLLRVHEHWASTASHLRCAHRMLSLRRVQHVAWVWHLLCKGRGRAEPRVLRSA